MGHKEIDPITSPLGGVYDNYKKFQPSIKVLDACVPFPAVGPYTASRGLKIGGDVNGQCGGGPGQVYVRHKNFSGRKMRGIMYAYYFPKDQVAAGARSAGHRHDWEEVIIWVSWNWSRKIKASMSGHGGYTTSGKDWNGNHKNVLYANGNTVKGISKEFRSTTSTGGYRHPIANWFQLSKAVKNTLENAVWKDQTGKQSATCKIVDARFNSKMDQALKASF